MNRREFLATSTAALAAAGFTPPPVRLKKAVKYGMIGDAKTPMEKLELAKACGFEGVEIDSPTNTDLDALVAASGKTGVKVHGVIDSIHWTTRFSDPKAETREKAVKALEGALRDAKKVGDRKST